MSTPRASAADRSPGGTRTRFSFSSSGSALSLASAPPLSPPPARAVDLRRMMHTPVFPFLSFGRGGLVAGRKRALPRGSPVKPVKRTGVEPTLSRSRAAWLCERERVAVLAHTGGGKALGFKPPLLCDQVMPSQLNLYPCYDRQSDGRLEAPLT